MKLFRARNIKKYYKTEDITIKAVDGIDIEIEESEFIAIVGKSGSGKTTLLNILAGLEKPDSGTVEINGRDISSMNRDEMAIFRRREIGIVFQAYNLVSTLSVIDNVLLPFILDGQNPDMKFVNDIMKSLGIYEKRNMLPHQLSGGEKQRTAIAIKPTIILADEPTGNLDSRMSKDVMNMMKVISEKYSQTLIVVTHDESIAQLADRVIHIRDGKVLNGVI